MYKQFNLLGAGNIIINCSKEINRDNKFQCMKGIDYKGDVIRFCGSRSLSDAEKDYYKLDHNLVHGSNISLLLI